MTALEQQLRVALGLQVVVGQTIQPQVVVSLAAEESSPLAASPLVTSATLDGAAPDSPAPFVELPGVALHGVTSAESGAVGVKSSRDR